MCVVCGVCVWSVHVCGVCGYMCVLCGVGVWCMCAECVCVFKGRDRRAEQVFLEYQREASVPKRRLSGSKCFKHMFLVLK